MASYDADLQAAVDAASIEKDGGYDGDLVDLLREQLGVREIETKDEAWLRQTAEGIRTNPNYLIEREPDDYTPSEDTDPAL